jgi:hypothetical protein
LKLAELFEIDNRKNVGNKVSISNSKLYAMGWKEGLMKQLQTSISYGISE